MSNLSYTQASLQHLLLELGVQLSQPLLRMLCWLMMALLEKTPAHLFRLAEKLPDDDTTDRARCQRVRRFLSNQRLVVSSFLPILVRLIRPLVQPLPQITLSLDRTCWQKRRSVVTILSVGLVGEGFCVPLFWIVLARAGNTRESHWQQVLTPVLDTLRSTTWLAGTPIVVAADREFASPKLAAWLWRTYRVESCLRAKRSEYLTHHHVCQKIARWLEPLQPGECRFLRACQVTRGCDFRMNVLLHWKKGAEEPWVVMTTLNRYPEAYATYRQRWLIEPMHRHWKSVGFDIEGTRVTQPERIERLLLPIALCYALCVLEGHRKEAAGQTTRASQQKRIHSLFLEGLASFCRILRSWEVSRIHRFWERLFGQGRWLDIMRARLEEKCVTY